jgi:hypothetical protein
MDISDFADYASVGADLVAILTIPTAVYAYWYRKKKEEQLAWLNLAELQKEADDLAYSRLYEDYNEFLKIVMQYPQFDLGDQKLNHRPELDELDNVRFQSLFNIFLSLAERAYLLFRTTSDNMKVKQWEGWRSYIVDVLSRPHVLKEYERERPQYDRDFVTEIDIWIKAQKVNESR